MKHLLKTHRDYLSDVNLVVTEDADQELANRDSEVAFVKKWAYMVIFPGGGCKAVLPGSGNSAPYSGRRSYFLLKFFKSSSVKVLVTVLMLALVEEAMKRMDESWNL
jgi:hypothetical protein